MQDMRQHGVRSCTFVSSQATAQDQPPVREPTQRHFAEREVAGEVGPDDTPRNAAPDRPFAAGSPWARAMHSPDMKSDIGSVTRPVRRCVTQGLRTRCRLLPSPMNRSRMATDITPSRNTS